MVEAGAVLRETIGGPTVEATGGVALPLLIMACERVVAVGAGLRTDMDAAEVRPRRPALFRSVR